MLIISRKKGYILSILKGSLNWNGKFTVLEIENGTQEFFFLLWKYVIYICTYYMKMERELF